ncbi:MAG: phage terminase large subunit [Bacteroidota bacterium]|nr:phage terminase large subunit [Bacteroidota bacterium]
MKIQYKKIWFNPLYFIVLELMKRGVVEFYIYGGKSSSKTITIGQIIAQLCIENNQSAICFRKVGGTIKTTLKGSMKLSISTSRLQSGYRTMDFSFKSMYNNATIILKGLDDENKAKGIEGYSYLYHDELDQFTEEDYKESINAFRGEIAKCYFAAWNPTNITSFVKTKIIDPEIWVECNLSLPSKNSFVKVSEDGRKALIKTLYTDNYWTVGSPCGTYGFVDQNTIDKYESQKEIDYHWYSINVLGEWGVIVPDKPFFYNYKPEKHETTESIPINDNLPICLSFDFNVVLSCLAGQVSVYDRYIRKIKEFHDPSANMDLPEFIDYIVSYFGKERRYLITGDASGNNKSAFTSGHSSGFSIIFNKLCELGVDFEDMVPTSNPSHYNSKLICNYILGKETDWLISATDCPITCNDYKRMEQDSSGGLNKKHADSNNYGHCGDTARYFDHVFLYDLWKEYVNLS